MSDCGHVQSSSKLVTQMLFVVERWDEHHEQWQSMKAFHVYHGSDVDTVKQSVVEYLRDNRHRLYRGEVIHEKLRATLVARESTVIDTELEVIES